MNPRHFFSELQRRNVYKVAVAYGVVAWLLIQVATQTFPFFEIPNWVVRVVILFLLLGFPIALVFAWVYELTPDGLKRTDEVSPNESIRRKTGRKLGALAGGVAALAIGLFLFRLARLESPARPNATTRSQPAVAPSLGAIPEKSIAILPFKPLSSQSRDEILEAGMADTLIAKLSTTREIIIPSLTSARKYAEQENDPIAAGRLLRVRTVLDGSLQKLADRIRVTARLINVADGASLWTGTFDEKFTDVFAVQDVIAQKVAAALALRLSGEEQTRLTKRYTENTEAYQLYLKGRFYWNKYTEEGFRKSIDYFQQALGKDPNYALAYSGLADSYSLMGDFGYAAARDCFPKAQEYAEKALKLDDALADGHLSLGIVRVLYDGDLESAERELRRAKELNPNNAQAYHFYGHYLQLVGRFDEAIEETKRGAAMDPTNSIISTEVGGAYFLARRFDEAVGYFRKTLEMDPTFIVPYFNIALVYGREGKYDQALAELEKAKSIVGDDPLLMVGCAHIYAKTGRRAEAQEMAEDLKRLSADSRALAWIYLGLDDTDQVFTSLNKLAEENRAALLWIKMDPGFDPIRSDPRWPELLRRAGFN